MGDGVGREGEAGESVEVVDAPGHCEIKYVRTTLFTAGLVGVTNTCIIAKRRSGTPYITPRTVENPMWPCARLH